MPEEEGYPVDFMMEIKVSAPKVNNSGEIKLEGSAFGRADSLDDFEERFRAQLEELCRTVEKARWS